PARGARAGDVSRSPARPGPPRAAYASELVASVTRIRTQPAGRPAERWRMRRRKWWQDSGRMKVYGLLGLLLVACTKPNPAACCLDEADCAANGFKEVRMCAAGLACVDHQCVVPSCSMTGCAAEAPVCNITTDVCEGCTESSQCSRFSDTNVCDTATGACVECVTAADCDAAEPVCDANRCRACKLDSECPPGACG